MDVFKTPYSEELARLYIRCFFPELNWNLEIGDRPDLQDQVNSIGIEVTEAANPFHKELSARVDLYIGKEKKEIPHSLEERFAKYGKIIAYPNEEYGIIHGCTFDEIPLCKDSISKAVKLKLEKLKNYIPFEKQGILVDEGIGYCSEEQIPEIIETVQSVQRDYDLSFDFLFIKCVHSIYYCNLKTAEYTRRNILDDERNELRIEAIQNLGREAEYLQQEFESNTRVEMAYKNINRGKSTP